MFMYLGKGRGLNFFGWIRSKSRDTGIVCLFVLFLFFCRPTVYHIKACMIIESFLVWKMRFISFENVFKLR